jgi:RNA polymerase subunit RPABC4/transcription elongation factor Spt4
MSILSPELINTVMVVLQVILAVLGGFFTALWISLVIWTFRDIRSRSRDVFAQLLATLLVLIFNLPGVLIYLILRPPERLTEAYERALEEEALLQDIEERAQCPSCKRRIEPDYILCPSCRTPLKKRCVNCDRILRLRWKVCPYCGAEQEPAESEPAPAGQQISWAEPQEAASPRA